MEIIEVMGMIEVMEMIEMMEKACLDIIPEGGFEDNAES